MQAAADGRWGGADSLAQWIEQLLGELRVWLTIGVSVIQNLWVLEFLSINQARAVLTRYLGSYSAVASQIPLDK